MIIPRAEHPNPQFKRSEWLNLNGVWEFETDKSASGKQRRLFERAHLAGSITVPFCPESTLSGVGDTDFLNCVWYRRDIEIPAAWQGGRILLHFGAVDHTATVYINGKKVCTHKGGYASFTADITPYLNGNKASLCVCAEDDTRDDRYASGKQSIEYASEGCFYTRVTGIWQTVWLEHVPSCYIRRIRLTPDVDNAALALEAEVVGYGSFAAEAFYEGKRVGSITLEHKSGNLVRGTLPLTELHLWEVGSGRLYDLQLLFGEDRVLSYFGMRSIGFDGYRFLLNGRSVFQRLVLDQGYYPDGLYTAPTEEDLIRDIQISMDVGYNGARLHQKVFEPLFLYHCDKMGYLVWGEYGSWGIKEDALACLPPMIAEWREIIERDYNHPALIGWCPLNEIWPGAHKGVPDYDILRSLYHLTKSLDPTRPCIDTSGGYHTECTDLYDIHDYVQDSAAFLEMFGNPDANEMLKEWRNHRCAMTAKRTGHYMAGQPLFVSEYGGIKWNVDSLASNAWGYGNAPVTEEEFKNRYKSLTDVLLDNPCMFGFCYTQLYDIEQEVNGLYTYARKPKFEDMEFFRAVNARKAKIED